MHFDLEIGLAVAVNVALDDGNLGRAVILDLQLAGFVMKLMCANPMEGLVAVALLGVDSGED